MQTDTQEGPEEDDLVLLTFKGSTDVMRQTLFTSATLEAHRSEMKAAGEDLQPEWASGAVVLLHAKQIPEARRRLQSVNPSRPHRRNQVITRQSRENAVKETLLGLPCRKRVKCSEAISMSSSLHPRTQKEPPAYLELKLIDRVKFKNTFIDDWDTETERSAVTKSTGDRLTGYRLTRYPRLDKQ